MMQANDRIPIGNGGTGVDIRFPDVQRMLAQPEVYLPFLMLVEGKKGYSEVFHRLVRQRIIRSELDFIL